MRCRFLASFLAFILLQFLSVMTIKTMIQRPKCRDRLVLIAGVAIKHCGNNGYWQTDNLTDLEHTDYDSCIHSYDDSVLLYKRTIILGIVLNSGGLALLLPAIMILILNRGLRRQQRIQIHIQFFASITLTSCSSLTWDLAVRLDRLSASRERSTLYNNQVFCKILYVLQKLAREATFFWMTCEGYFLHRLTVNAFLPPKSLYGYLIAGWLVPCVLLLIYGVVRRAVANDSLCWLLPLEGPHKAIEWTLVYVPTICCIFVNAVFMFNILKQLLTKMITHPNEPSTFRKALKAAFVLVPLFGLHQFCLIYRPASDDSTKFHVYEFASSIILNSQGIVISLVFCYFNNEVQGYITSGVAKLKQKYDKRAKSQENRKSSLSSQSDSCKTSISSLPTLTTHLDQIPRMHLPLNGQTNHRILNEVFYDSSAVEVTHM